MKTPAATIVAAWMRAEIGVGPSIASGSHVWSGNWADLPTAPPSRRRPIRDKTPAETVLTFENTWWKSRVSKVQNTAITPRIKRKSPTLFIRKAFIAASAALFFLYQNPIKR